MNRALIISLALSCTLNLVNAQQTAVPFEDGERVCFVGNSITHYGQYPKIVALFYQTRYPEESFRFFNCGIGGDALSQINMRFEEDVFSKDPTYITLMTGANDAWGTYYNDPDTAYVNEMNRSKLNTFKTKAIETVSMLNENAPLETALIFTCIYDQTSEIDFVNYVGKNDLIRQIGAHMEYLSGQNDYGFIDFNTPMLEINLLKQQDDPAYSLCGTDRTHPGWPGHTVMAYHFLKAQLGESMVAAFELDARNQGITFTENCSVSNIQAQGSEFSFVYTPEALPFPMINESQHGTFSDGLELVPFAEDLNQEMIKVTGLPGQYELRINGIPIDSLSGSQLASGVDIGFNTKTPQQAKSQQILALMNEAQNKERIIRGAAYIYYKLLPKAGLSHASPVADQEAVINEWAGTTTYRQLWAQAYWDIYHDPVKKEAIYKEFNEFFVEIDLLNDPGSYTITLVRTDENQAPIANAGPDQVLEDTDGNGFETVLLDASESSDVDGTIISYIWMEDGHQIASGKYLSIDLPTGTHLLTLIVEDNEGSSNAVEFTVLIEELVSSTTRPGNQSLRNSNGFLEGIGLFPNPATHYVNIWYELSGSGTLKLSMYNSTGRLVHSLELQDFHFSENRYTLALNTVDQLEEGLYLLCLKDGERSTSIPLLIQ